MFNMKANDMFHTPSSEKELIDRIEDIAKASGNPAAVWAVAMMVNNFLASRQVKEASPKTNWWDWKPGDLVRERGSKAAVRIVEVYNGKNIASFLNLNHYVRVVGLDGIIYSADPHDFVWVSGPVGGGE